MSSPADPVPLGDWLTARGPFRQLRSALLDAEAHLNGHLTGTTPVQWHRLRAAFGDDAAALTALDDLLVAQQVRLRMTTAEGRWLLGAVGGAGRESAAAVAIAVLSDAGGSGRLKGCRRGGCGQVFLDWTNGAQRSGCRLHPSRPTPDEVALDAPVDGRLRLH